MGVLRLECRLPPFAKGSHRPSRSGLLTLQSRRDLPDTEHEEASMEAGRDLVMRSDAATGRTAELGLTDCGPVTLRAFTLRLSCPTSPSLASPANLDHPAPTDRASDDVAALELVPNPVRSTNSAGRAPRWLQVSVGGLAVISVLALGGLVAEHAAPQWFASVRGVATSLRVATPRRSITELGNHQARAQSPRLQLVSTTLSTASYVVPDTSYTVAISVEHPCWIAIESPASGRSFSATLEPSAGPTSFTVSGQISLMVAARANSISISHGSERLGTINAPIVGLTYDFTPVP